jgi:hypothetical protein
MGVFGCISVPLLILVLLVVFGVTTINSIVNGVTSIFRPPQTTATVFSTRTLVNSLLPLGQLVTVSTELAKADITVNIRAGALNACGHSGTHVATGTVEAGIDLSKFDESKVSYDEETNTYTLTLPAPQLTSCRIDYIRQYDQSTTICGIDWDEVRLLAHYAALSDFREDAMEGGILERSRNEAEILVGNFVHALTGSEAKIVFEEADAAVISNSCQAQLPEGWLIDPATNEWTKP